MTPQLIDLRKARKIGVEGRIGGNLIENLSWLIPSCR